MYKDLIQEIKDTTFLSDYDYTVKGNKLIITLGEYVTTELVIDLENLEDSIINSSFVYPALELNNNGIGEYFDIGSEITNTAGLIKDLFSEIKYIIEESE